jgi:hypothetical protein
MANTTLQVKKSGVTGNVPSSLEYGELALNYADGKLYYKASNGTITYIQSGTTTDSFATVNANSSLILATSPTDTLSILPGNNITIDADTINKTITINAQDADIDQFARNTANSAYGRANDAIDLAQAAYDYANTIPGGGGGGNLNVTNDVSTNAARFITFTSANSGNISTIFTSDNKLTYNPSSGTIRLNQLEVTSNTNISSNNKVITGTSATPLDTFSADQYRGAFYQVQMEAGGSFHVLNLSIVNSGGTAQVTSFGDAFNAGALATFSVSVLAGVLTLTITPVSGSTTVSFLRHLLVKQTVGIPVGDLGWVGEAATVFFDAGFDLDPTDNSFDYGFVS